MSAPRTAFAAVRSVVCGGVFRALLCIVLLMPACGAVLRAQQGTNQGRSAYDEYFGGGAADDEIDFLNPENFREQGSYRTREYSNDLNGRLEQVRDQLYGLLCAVLGIAALVLLAVSAFSMMGGDQGAAKRLLVWGVGLAVSFGVLFVFRNLSGGFLTDSHGTDASGTAFASIRVAVGSALTILLEIVSMVATVLAGVHLMRGERDGAERFLKTLLVGVVGITLLNVI